MPKIKIEGSADIDINVIHCVCGKCSNHDNSKILIELNFQEKKLIYRCSKCKEENCLHFGQIQGPYPSLGVGTGPVRR